MTDDNAFGRVAQDLRAAVAGRGARRAAAVGARADGAPPRRARRPCSGRSRALAAGGPRRAAARAGAPSWPPRRRPSRPPRRTSAGRRSRSARPRRTPAALHAHAARCRRRARSRSSSGYPDESLQPTGLLAAALARAARRPGSWARGPDRGRRAPARAGSRCEAGGALPRRTTWSSRPGAQAALSTALRVARRARRRRCSSSRRPTSATIAAARVAGRRVVPVPADRDGVRPDLLAAALRATGARSVVLPAAVRQPARRDARRRPPRRGRSTPSATAGAFLVEDDYARDLALDGEPPPPLAADDPDGHVVYLRSLTKAAAPGPARRRPSRARGAGRRPAARGPGRRRLLRRRARCRRPRSTSSPPRPGAGTAARPRAALRERRDALVAAVRRHVPGAPHRPRPARRLRALGPRCPTASTTSRSPPPPQRAGVDRQPRPAVVPRRAARPVPAPALRRRAGRRSRARRGRARRGRRRQ